MRFSAIAFAVVLLGASPSRAQTQVSDGFLRVAKALIKTTAVDALSNICDGMSASVKPVCRAVVKRVAAVVALALDKTLTATSLSHEVLGLVEELTESAVASASKRFIESRLGEALAPLLAGHPGCTAAIGTIAEDVSRCLIVQAIKKTAGGAAGDPDPCKSILTHAHVAAACGIVFAAPPSETDPVQALDALRDGLAATLPLARQYDLKNALNSLVDLFKTAKNSKTIYEAVSHTVDVTYVLYFNTVTTPGSETITRPDQVKKALGIVNLCDPTFAARLASWQGVRQRTAASLETSLVEGTPFLAADLAEIPRDLPNPNPACPSLPFLTKVQKSGVAYYSDLQLARTLDGLVWPAMLVAVLVDYVRSNDAAALKKNLIDFTLRLMRRSIAAFTAFESGAKAHSPLECAAAGCTDVAGNTTNPASPTGNAADLGAFEGRFLEAQYSLDAAQSTCIYQAVSAVLVGAVDGSTKGWCRVVDLPGAGDVKGVAIEDTLFNALLGAPIVFSGVTLRPWTGPVFTPVNATQARLELASRLDAQVAFGLVSPVIDAVIEKLHPVNLSPQTELAFKAVAETAAAIVGNRDGGPKALLASAGRILEPIVNDFLDTYIAPSTCKADTLACGVRVLIAATYDPLMAYAAKDNPTASDREALIEAVYTNVATLDPLSQTPVLFNVGLGATVLYGGDVSSHLTLLEKIGIATRWGDRKQWELGIFAGGFIDALIRAATGSSANQYWLFGATLGIRQFSKSSGFGLEAHLGLGLPYDLSQIPKQTVVAGGLTLVVPFDVFFGQN